ncbi:MAG: aminotransferase class I/II-fold pyridoxal phosphate-dependent enzyme [bacterium]
MDLFQKCRSFTRAQQAIEEGWYPYFKAIQSGADIEVMIKGHKMIMAGSNNYLGLTQDPRVKRAAIDAIEKFGSGCTGSRFLNGTLELHEELEHRLAGFMKREAALVFSTGFQTNLGVIATLVGKDEMIFTDRANHASIVDGSRLAFGETVRYRHNDMNHLERLLAKHKDAPGKVIIADGVFSMEGDIVKLPEMALLAEKYGARIIIDDAHSIGVLGQHGRGTGEHYGMEDKVDLVIGTFSKSFASIGGFVVGDHYVIDYIKHHARSLIFSASMPPASTAAVIAAVDILEKEPERIEWLWRNVHKMKKAFDDLGFNTGGTQSPIIPLHIGEDMQTFEFWRMLFESGIFTNPVISPAVPQGHGLIRTSYMATHTNEILDQIIEAFARIGKQFGLV